MRHDNARESRRLTAIDLFSGAGGFSLGFEQAGFDVMAALDHDPVHLATYAYNFPQTELICADVQGVSAERVLEAARRSWERAGNREVWDGALDVLFGGPSCQGFSVIGRRDTSDPRNDLVFEFARLVRELKPRYFVLENVPGLLSPGYAGVMQHLLNRLRRAGYSVPPPRVLNAQDHGVPQMRRRVFIIGWRTGQQPLAWPDPMVTRRVARDALSDLPDLDRYPALYREDATTLSADDVSLLGNEATDFGRLMRSTTREEGDLSTSREWDRYRWTCSGLTRHSPAVVERFANLACGSQDSVGRLQRLSPDQPAPTLRAGTGRDHGSFTSARPIHYAHPRVITVREAARLHSFPDWFRFHSTKWHGFRQVGNSVPPLLARAVAEQIIRASNADPARWPNSLRLGEERLLSLSLTEAADHFGFDRALLPSDVRRATEARQAA
ncbi:MAG: DNA cytosine methyltransferase [Chloroflexota bacterium]